MMKLRDLVANSLPRVRGRKKKTTPMVTQPWAAHEQDATRPALDKNANRYPAYAPKYEPGNVGAEAYGISEASWRGNALYRGLDASSVGEAYAHGQAAYVRGGGLVASHSAEGFSSHLVASRSYDARMAVSEFNGSCSQMSSISETGADLYPASHYHCHYHRHNHHYHHHVHGGNKPMASVDQNQQQAPGTRDVAYLPSYGVEASSKRDVGFFKKSFASFKSMRKCSRAGKELAEISPVPDQSRCSVCPYPEAVLFDRKSSDKRPAKPKRKGLKGFSRSKENKDISKDKGDKSWFSDNDASQVVTPPPPRHEPPTVGHSQCAERSRFRECSVESCASRLYSGSREGSNVREIDVNGFDSASLSGYESDFPRSKAHRSRSRIKTNPWLPSPQPSGGRRSENSDLRESKEDIAGMDDVVCRVPRSASFELRRSNAFMSSVSSWKGDSDDIHVQRHRSLTPLDIKATFGFNQSNAQCKSHAAPKLNDLNCDRSRPTSIVSPNTEFAILTDNLEQLASNISFEYEDMLDSTLESASVFQEDGQASIQELLTDEDVGNNAKRRSASGFLKSDLAQQSAHSPDSGVGGLTSSDADDTTASPNAESRTLSDPPLSTDLTLPCLNALEHVSNLSSNANNYYQDKDSLSHRVKPSTLEFSDSVRIELEDATAAVSESDADNTTYDSSEPQVKTLGSPLLRCKTDAPQCAPLMVNERLDIRFHPAHRLVAGSRLTQEFPVKVSNGMISNRFSDPVDGTPKRISRPSVLKPITHVTQLNDIEKCSSSPLAKWSDAFSFPKNISATECIESPTDNWQWDDPWGDIGHLSMYGSPEAVVSDRVEVCRSNTEESLFLEHAFLQRSRLSAGRIVKSNSPGPVDMTSEVASLMDCIMDRGVDTRHLDLSFDMSDASVQTDFDDDFSMWEEADSFEHFRSNPPEPSESTRLWLLTGNMQGSADTGYSSLTRDSQILMDEDTLFLAGELEKRKSSDGLSHYDMPQRLLSNLRSPRNSLLFDAPDGNKRSGTHIILEHALASPRDPVSDTVATPSGKTSMHKKPGPQRAISKETVNQMFSSIELQFQEIFQQIQPHEKKPMSRRNVSSEHLKSSVAVCEAGSEPKPPVLKDAETGENKDCVLDKYKTSVCESSITHIDEISVRHENIIRKQKTQVNGAALPNAVTSRQNADSQGVCEKAPQKHDSHERLQEKADYLAFLKDVPLRRTHLKRPLFLVPGVGPVDMSHAEQLNMFSESSDPAPTPSLSPAGKHTGKKQKFKKGHAPDGGHRSSAGGAKASECTTASHFQTHTKDSFPTTPIPGANPCNGSQKCGVQNGPQAVSIDSIPKPQTPLSFRETRDLAKSCSLKQDAHHHGHSSSGRDSSGEDFSGMRNLAAKVLSLRQEKELVFRKIQEAQRDEVCRQEQRSLLERSLHAKRKQALLDNLRELRFKLEEQSRKLKP